MANSKRYTGGGGGEHRCAVHRGTSQEKWRRTQYVAEDIAGNLKEAIKVLQDERTPVTAPFSQEKESKRKSAIKKAVNKLGRALNQVSTVELYTADLHEEMQNIQKKLEASETAQKELSEQMEASTSKMHDQVRHCKSKLQEAVDRLHSEEDLMASMLKELEAARLSADLAQKERLVVEEQLRQRETERGGCVEGHYKSTASEESLRAENEMLKKQYMTALKERGTINGSTEISLKNAAVAVASVERYKEVVAKVTADNMVFLMKLKHSEAALRSTHGRVEELQKECSAPYNSRNLLSPSEDLHPLTPSQELAHIVAKIDTLRAQWLEEASAEIQDIIRSSLRKAEISEAKLQMLQQRQGKIVEEWEVKLLAATEKLEQVSSSRDWLEENLKEAMERHKVLEDDKYKLQQMYENECHQRQHAEAESRALICTLRRTNEELAKVSLELEAAVKETEAQKRCVLQKQSEVNNLMADLEKANCLLETKQAINAALMKKKEEVEWELMAVEAQRVKLQPSLYERLHKNSGSGPGLLSIHE